MGRDAGGVACCVTQATSRSASRAVPESVVKILRLIYDPQSFSSYQSL
jgi:hypothetical protein